MAMPHYGTTTLDPSILVNPDPDFVLFCHLHIPGLVVGTSRPPNGQATVTVPDNNANADVILEAAKSSTWTVIQRGPRRLWDTIEHASRLWPHVGKPKRDRYGITALDRADRQFVWLDNPDGPYSWPMPL